jgi:hypothetical protein
MLLSEVCLFVRLKKTGLETQCLLVRYAYIKDAYIEVLLYFAVPLDRVPVSGLAGPYLSASLSVCLHE